jgi:hypothetical protein
LCDVKFIPNGLVANNGGGLTCLQYGNDACTGLFDGSAAITGWNSSCKERVRACVRNSRDSIDDWKWLLHAPHYLHVLNTSKYHLIKVKRMVLRIAACTRFLRYTTVRTVELAHLTSYLSFRRCENFRVEQIACVMSESKQHAVVKVRKLQARCCTSVNHTRAQHEAPEASLDNSRHLLILCYIARDSACAFAQHSLNPNRRVSILS